LFMQSSLSDFDFDLPAERIALTPAVPRDHARLLHMPAGGGFEYRHVFDLLSLLHEGDVLVLNDSKVIPARLFGKRGLARIEILLHRDVGNDLWEVFARPIKRLREGDIIIFAEDFSAQVEAIGEEGLIRLRFKALEENFRTQLERYGFMPLPPYIRRAAEAAD